MASAPPSHNRRKEVVCPCEMKQQIEQMIEDVENFSKAFPEGIDKHRQFHEAATAAKNAEKEFYDSLKTEVMKKGVAGIFAVIVIILGLALTGLGHELVSNGVIGK